MNVLIEDAHEEVTKAEASVNPEPSPSVIVRTFNMLFIRGDSIIMVAPKGK